MRILQVGNAQMRRFGAARVSTETKLYNGLIRDDHHVLHFSDRDMAAFLAPFRLRDLGKGKADRKLRDTAVNFRPDMILLGHCDIITNRTLEKIRAALPDVRIAYRNVDALFVPRNVEVIHRRSEVVDAIFLTTAGAALAPFRGKRARVYYMPNPTDPAIETLDNSERDDLSYDLFFCGSDDGSADRGKTLAFLREHLPDNEVTFKVFGYFGEPNVWGRAYEAVLEKSRMGLNLNRQEGDYLCSSARLAQLMGNGILAFIHRAGRLNELIGEDTAVFFETDDELLKKVRELANDDAARKAIAAKGRRFYREHFTSKRVARYIVERTMERKLSQQYIWAEH